MGSLYPNSGGPLNRFHSVIIESSNMYSVVSMQLFPDSSSSSGTNIFGCWFTLCWPNMTFVGVMQDRWQVNWCCFTATLSSLDTIANKKGQTEAKHHQLPSIDCSGRGGNVGPFEGVAKTHPEKKERKSLDHNDEENEIYYATSQQIHTKKT